MADLDVSDALDDPDFYDDTLVVRRATITQESDGTATATPTEFGFVGVVIPDGGQDLIQDGSGDAVQGDITIYTRLELTSGAAETDSDIVKWGGSSFRVINAQPWRYGTGYTRAVCKLIQLNVSEYGEADATGYAA